MYDVRCGMDDVGWMMLFAGSIGLIQLLAAMCKQLYKFFAIVMETFELNVS